MCLHKTAAAVSGSHLLSSFSRRSPPGSPVERTPELSSTILTGVHLIWLALLFIADSVYPTSSLCWSIEVFQTHVKFHSLCSSSTWKYVLWSVKGAWPWIGVCFSFNALRCWLLETDFKEIWYTSSMLVCPGCKIMFSYRWICSFILPLRSPGLNKP